MHLRELSLDAFRSYPQLRLTLEPGLTLIVGDNAAGKSNLLEAIYLLAATRSPRASTEGEMIAWGALAGASVPAPAVTRVAGTAARAAGAVTVEIALVTRSDARGQPLLARSGAPLTSKRLRLNGIARRATEVVGRIAAVLFTTLDIETITGAPSQRRRYLDLTITQSDRGYARAYGRYDKALTQRNALLKRLREGSAVGAGSEQLRPWEDVIAEEGGVVMAARAAAVAALGQAAAAHYRTLAPAQETASPLAPGAQAGALALEYRPALEGAALETIAAEALREAMARLRPREIAAGTTLVGPHRDDLLVRLGERSATAYASRAQLRSAALALRLAEADRLWALTGERPLLLLDDVFSELDPARREAAVATIAPAEQVLLTTADPASLPRGLPRPAAAYRLAAGRLLPPSAG